MNFCDDLAEKLNIKCDCCDSCHNDSDNGYASLIEKEINGIYYQICCSMSIKIEK